MDIKSEILIPNGVGRGEKVAILSPASPVKQEFIDSAADRLRQFGFEPVVMPHAKGPAWGSYAASLDGRLDDFINAWKDESIKAVICSRGGYGAVHLLPYIPADLLRSNPKWLVGFSDISALHALSLSQGVASIHGPMCRHLNGENPGGEAVLEILSSGRFPRIEALNVAEENIPRNRSGRAEGMLAGGNVAVLNGLAATPFDILSLPLHNDVILFIEDIAEPIYKIERILYRLLLQGVLHKIKGLIVGRFTESGPNRNYPSVEMMIADFLNRHRLDSFPVTYGFPIGHTEENMPVAEGARILLDVEEGSSILTYL